MKAVEFEHTLADDRVRGNHVFDAHIAALLSEHGVDTLVTADADFHRYPHITVENPLDADA